MGEQTPWSVWAIGASGEQARERFRGGRSECFALGQRIARSSGAEGAVSVWVASPAGEVAWAAGQKARELLGAGVVLDEFGFAGLTS